MRAAQWLAREKSQGKERGLRIGESDGGRRDFAWLRGCEIASANLFARRLLISAEHHACMVPPSRGFLARPLACEIFLS